MTLEFVKMQGTGNDYIYIDCRKQAVSLDARRIEKLCDRHFGIGGDGVVLIKPSEVADGYMEMYNRDGSPGRMCGNGLRCVAKYIYDRDPKNHILQIETPVGIKRIILTVIDGVAVAAAADMGSPIFDAGDIPLIYSGDSTQVPLTIAGQQFSAVCLSMGNPHAVVFVDNPASMDLRLLGPLFERHPFFPQRVNIEFVRLADDGDLELRVWERGAGETLACGTGACAAAVAAIIRGYCRRDKTVMLHLPGGRLEALWRADGGVTMTGNAVEVFRGTLTL